MPRSSRLLALTPGVAALALIAVGAGCAPEPTAPKPPATRSVNVHVSDVAGAPVSLAYVFAGGPAPGQSDYEFTDTSGTAHFTLEPGAWSVYTSMPGNGGPAQVAGGTGTVPPSGADTVLYRLQLADEAVVFGQVLLTNRTNHATSFLGVFDLPLATETIADGTCRLDGVPRGHWQGFAAHIGFQLVQFDLVIPAPGDTVTVSPITLVPSPTP